MPRSAHTPPPTAPASAAPSEGEDPRPLHARPRLVAWVATGGVVGTAARLGVLAALPRADDLPVPVLVINLVGAFALGLLLEALARRGPDTGRRRLARLGLGTGVLGAFTTYSTFAVDAVELTRDHRAGAAAAYVLVSLLGGFVATGAGVWLAAAQHRRRAGGRA